MGKVITYFIILAFITSCKESKKPLAQEGISKVVAVYIRPDSGKAIDILLRQIIKTIKYDSVNQKDIITIDTLWGYPKLFPLTDSLGKQVTDSSGKPKINPAPVYMLIKKDSVNWQIQGVPIDKLLKL